MPRRPSHESFPEQYQVAYEMFNRGVKGQAIARQIWENFGNSAVTERSVFRWIERFRGTDLGLDRAYRWSDSVTAGLPWESGSYLLNLKQIHKKLGLLPAIIYSDRYSEPYSPLTVRQAQWCWRVHLAAPDIENARDVYMIGHAFAARELESTLLKHDIVVDDLEDWLEYGPWRSEPDLDEYREAVAGNKIAPLIPRVMDRVPPKHLLAYSLYIGMWWPNPNNPVLPSQIRTIEEV